MPKLSSIQNFGEQFLSVIQNIKKERAEKEQFEKEMRYKFRQQNLMNTYYKGILENQVTDNILAREKFEYDKTLVPETKPVKGASIEFKEGIGHVEVKTEDGRPVDYNMLKGIGSTGSGSGSGTTTTKEPKLTEAGSNGLAYLKDPIFTTTTGKDLYNKTDEQVANEFSRAINAIQKDVLGSRATNWFENITRQYGRVPTSTELDSEIIKHASGEGFTATLSDVEVGQLNRLSEYLEDVEPGIKKIQKRLNKK